MTRPITLDDPAAYFERLSVFEANHWWSAATWRVAEHWLDAGLRGRVGLEAIDVGCGAGLTLSRLAVRPEIGRVVGIDPSPEALAHVRGHRVLEASATSLPFADGSFDVATCLDVIQHLAVDEVAMAIAELARVLRAGGLLVVRTNAGQGGIEQDALRTGFERKGFRVVRSSRVNCLGSLAQEARGRLRPSRHRSHPAGGGLPLGRASTWSDRVMTWIGRAEASVVGRLGWRLPFGHSAMMLLIRG